MSLDPRTFPTPTEPKWTAGHIWAEYLNDDQEIAVSTDLVFEYYWGPFMELKVCLLSGYGYDVEQAQEIIHHHFNTLTITFEYA
jgi:hypothetical protein